MDFIKKMGKKMDAFIQDNMSGSAHQHVLFGSVAFIGFPLFYFLWSFWYLQQHDYGSVDLWCIGTLLGLGLMLTPLWPKSFKHWIPWYWFLTLLYVLPFFFTYSFFINRANDLSSMSLLCSVFLLVLLVDFLSLSILIFLGVSLAFISYYLVSPEIYFNAEHLEVALLAVFFIIAGSTVNYRTTALQQQRMLGMAAAAGMIAHELRTPLLGIKSGAQALKTSLPKLFEAYRIAKEHGLLINEIRSSRLQQLDGVNDRIISEINYANTIIDMLLIKAGRDNSLQNCELEHCSMADCLQEAIDRYPFRTDAARELVSWQGDFGFIGSRLLMQHIIFNILKNALYAIAKAGRGEITIWTGSDELWNYLYVKDTAIGMSPKQLKQLFDHFYTTKFMGTGIGLSFCKLVMQRFGGDIYCEAEEGVYTQFTLTFPRSGLTGLEKKQIMDKLGSDV